MSLHFDIVCNWNSCNEVKFIHPWIAWGHILSIRKHFPWVVNFIHHLYKSQFFLALSSHLVCLNFTWSITKIGQQRRNKIQAQDLYKLFPKKLWRLAWKVFSQGQKSHQIEKERRRLSPSLTSVSLQKVLIVGNFWQNKIK
jgi:hypothetical protein